MNEKILREKSIHSLFELSLMGKGVIALFEIVAGILAYLVTQQFILNIALAVTQDELAEDPRDYISSYLLHAAQNLSITTRHFTAFFLLSHGVIKMALIVGLVRKIRWCYPAAIVVFAQFIAYQLYRFSFTHSPWLLVINALDCVVIWLTWHEYKVLKNSNA